MMTAAALGSVDYVKLLLSEGANVSAVNHHKFTALHLSAQNGYLAVTNLLLKEGAGLERTNFQGATPLCLAAIRGHAKVVKALIEAGANPNSRSLNGASPLFMAAQEGHMDVVKLLLHAKANPLLTNTHALGVFVPLDVAARAGHSEVVLELIRQLGIEGCAGPSGGTTALELAARGGCVDTTAVLTQAGVVDTGFALAAAAGCGREAVVRYLLHRKKQGSAGGLGAYADACCRLGSVSAVFRGMEACSPRVVRLLVDAGAATATRTWIYDSTPLGLVTVALREKRTLAGEEATEDQLRRLEAIRRLLLQVEAVHAVSWLWPSGSPSMGGLDAEVTPVATATSTSPSRMLSISMRRTRTRGALLAAMLRWVAAWVWSCIG